MGRRTAFILLCTFCIVVVGIGPSSVLNILPYLANPDTRLMAFVQIVFVLGAALTPVAIPELRWYWVPPVILLWLFLLSGCCWSGIEASALARGDLSAGREEKAATIGRWDTQLEGLKNESESLKKQYIPLDERAKDYTPTSEVVWTAAKEGRDNANSERDRACKYTNDATCKALIQKAETKQAVYLTVTQNYEITKRVDGLEDQIKKLSGRLDDMGSPTPDHLKKAALILSRLTSVPPEVILEDKVVHVAVLAELWAGFSPTIIIVLLSLVFRKLYGENWWEEAAIQNESPSAGESPLKPNPEMLRVASHPVPESLYTPKKAPLSAAYLAYEEGVRAWVTSVTDGTGERYTVSQVFPHYVKFCEARTFKPCKAPTSLGSILKNACNLRPAVKKGGQNYYLFNLAKQPHLTLIKTELAG